MPELVSLTEFRTRLNMCQPSAQRAWKAGRLVGRRLGDTPNSPIELNWVASVKSLCETSTKYKLEGCDVIDVNTSEIVWTFKPEEIQVYTYLQRKVPEKIKSKESISAEENELRNLADFSKLGLQVYDDKGHVRSIVVLAREQEALFKAKRAQLDYEKEQHKLVEIEMVQQLIANVAVDTCKAILTVPDRIAPVLSTMEDVSKIHKYLTTELTYALNSLSTELEKAFTDGSSIKELYDEDFNDDQLSNAGGH